MTPAARVAAAIELVATFQTAPKPADQLLQHWFRHRRFAGSKDRRAIREIVFLVMRRWSEAVHAVDSDSPRLLVAAALHLFNEVALPQLADLYAVGRYAPGALDQRELERLAAAEQRLATAPRPVRLEIPGWLEADLMARFADTLEQEMEALQQRAPLDLRVNTVRATRAKALERLATEGIVGTPTELSPVGIRVQGDAHLTGTRIYGDGLVEVQDEGSQLAALLSRASPDERIVDYCAGAGGKTLALSTMMGGTGQLLAFDVAEARLRRLAERAARAGAANVECHVLAGASSDGVLQPLANAADRVIVDAPCSGTGTWRRAPDAKWRLTAEKLSEYRDLQIDVLDAASRLVRPGGTLVYVTCSLLDSENLHQVEDFLSRHPDFTGVNPADNWAAAVPQSVLPPAVDEDGLGLLLTPHRCGTDGFYIAVLTRRR